MLVRWDSEPRHWIRLNCDTGAAVTAFLSTFVSDVVGNGSHDTTATGELALDHGAARIRGRVEGVPLDDTTCRRVQDTTASASKCAVLGHSRWTSEHGG